MKNLNMTYVKTFVTKFAKDTGAAVNLDSMHSNKNSAKVVYEKEGICIYLHINSSELAKYEVTLQCDLCSISFLTDNLNEVVQACDLLIQPAIKYGRPIELKAMIKSNHWGVKLVTVERTDGYRANLYVSSILRLLSTMQIVNIHNVKLGYDVNKHKVKASYSKDVLNYDKIQKEGNWNMYTAGFEPIRQFPEGSDYMHPSLKWQKGRLF